ncbi:hypothetical protein A2U01_0101678, partial [Trifolium medium]|nr:hypothetical protein [Trifolium medium]
APAICSITPPQLDQPNSYPRYCKSLTENLLSLSCCIRLYTTRPNPAASQQLRT